MAIHEYSFYTLDVWDVSKLVLKVIYYAFSFTDFKLIRFRKYVIIEITLL